MCWEKVDVADEAVTHLAILGALERQSTRLAACTSTCVCILDLRLGADPNGECDGVLLLFGWGRPCSVRPWGRQLAHRLFVLRC